MNNTKLFCLDRFWDEILYYDKNTFTNCFQYTLLMIGPILFLAIFIFFVIKIIGKSQFKNQTIDHFNDAHIIKFTLPIFCAVFSATEMAIEMFFHKNKDPLLIISYISLIISLIFVSLSIRVNSFRRPCFDVSLLAFWWLVNIAYSIRFYIHFHKVRQDWTILEIFYFVISSFIMLLLLSSLIMDCFFKFHYESGMVLHPEMSSSIFSQITYLWMDKYICQWYKREMTNETAFNLSVKEKSAMNTTNIENILNNEEKKIIHTKEKSSQESLLKTKCKDEISDEISRMHLIKSLFQANFKLIIIAWFLKIFRDILIITLPLILKHLLKYCKEKDNNDIEKGILFAIIFFSQGTLGSIFENYSFILLSKIGIRVRGALMGLVYKKTIRLSAEATVINTVGDVLNMISVDIEQIMLGIDYSWFLVSCPFQVIVTMILLYLELGYAIFVGFVTVGALIPLNYVTTKFIRTFTKTELQWKDKRMNILLEVLNGIKIVKMYVWEKCFNDRISKLRNKEMKNIRKISIGWCLISVIWDLAPFLVMYTTFASYIRFFPSSIINAEKVFVSLVLFNNLQLPIMLLPWGTSQLISALVSISRIEKLLEAAENKSYHKPLDENEIDSNISVFINNGQFSWSLHGKPVLNNINISIHKNKLIAIIGKVGVGKSSLLSSILGETYCLKGTVQVQGKVAIVPQEAWIQNTSLRNNILLTKEYDKAFYDDVVKACCLDYDINTFPLRDEIKIGERGINLSGGQKQRISLARALYQDSDIYLLDDPLSAVDVNVGKHLFKNVLSQNGLLKNKTRILVTNVVKWLPFVDEIIVINSEGMIFETGTYEHLLNYGQEFKCFVKESYKNLENDCLQKEFIDKDDDWTNIKSSVSFSSEKDENIKATQEEGFIIDSIAEEEEEEVMKGKIKWNTLFWFFKYMGICVFILSILSCSMFSGLQAYSNVLLSRMTQEISLQNFTKNTNNTNLSVQYINYYGIIGIGQFITVVLFWGGFTYGSLQASKKIHKALLNSILKGTLSFFNKTSSGRIINRFSRDLYYVDHIINLNITDIINRTVILFTSILVISIVTPWVGLVCVPVMTIYFLLKLFYISSSRQSRRLDSTASSFCFTHLVESYKGSSIIRAFNVEDDFENIQYSHIDNSNKFKIIQRFSLRWLCFRLDILGNIIVFCAVIFGVISKNSLNPSLVGLSVSYALQITNILNWLMRQWSEFETNAVAIERLKEYTMIPHESQFGTEVSLPENWVSNGNISFQNFSLQYHNNEPLVLKDISININAGEKVGIVGRTGAGKSTLSLALFRLIEGCNGKILIDGVDINSVSLHELRRQITIIPQDPIIFLGTLKQNLDPFHEYSKDRLIETLEQSGLIDWVNTLEENIEYNCGNMGTNLSVGQRQLVCLARTILKKSQIIILDEATSSVDEETDRKVMAAIKSQFVNSTVLIIAHRINSIIDCDKILVLEEGVIVEYGSPKQLLSNLAGIFRSMAMPELKMSN